MTIRTGMVCLGAVQQAYAGADLDYRPRYTPVMRVLAQQESATVGQLAELAGITQPAASQTVALMKKEGLLLVTASDEDGRQRLVRLSLKGQGTAATPAGVLAGFQAGRAWMRT